MSRLAQRAAGLVLALGLLPVSALAADAPMQAGHDHHAGHEHHGGHGSAIPSGHAGHDMTMHDMAGMEMPAPAPAPAASASPAPVMPLALPPAAMDHGASGHMAPARFSLLRIDELEAVDGETGRAVAWDGSVSWGGPFDRVWLASEGERAQGGDVEQETALFWSHAVSRWWDTTLGVRQDRADGERRDWVMAGVRGLAPYWFETEATAYVGPSGRSLLRLRGEVELLITNRLILQPQVELNLLGRDDDDFRQGRGLSDSEWGLRLRYEIRREFAPYLGVVRQVKHGRTADLARADGDPVGDTQLVVGVRLWY